MEKESSFNKTAWAKKQSLKLAKSYLKENPTVTWSEEFLQQCFFKKIMKALEKTKV